MEACGSSEHYNRSRFLNRLTVMPGVLRAVSLTASEALCVRYRAGRGRETRQINADSSSSSSRECREPTCSIVCEGFS